jgi:DNA-binding MarR family transcriptional regulator
MEKFTEFWCFRLNVLSRKISRKYNSKCLEYGITAPQSFVLFDLLDHEGSTVKDIARLYKEELVKREEDPNDRRSLNIYLTAKGRQLAEDLFPTGREFNLYLRSLLDEDRAETFEKLLKAIDEKVQ